MTIEEMYSYIPEAREKLSKAIKSGNGIKTALELMDPCCGNFEEMTLIENLAEVVDTIGA